MRKTLFESLIAGEVVALEYVPEAHAVTRGGYIHIVMVSQMMGLWVSSRMGLWTWAPWRCGSRRTRAVTLLASLIALTRIPIDLLSQRLSALSAVLEQVVLAKGVGIARGTFRYGEVEWHGRG